MDGPHSVCNRLQDGLVATVRNRTQDHTQPHTRPYATGRVRFQSSRAKMVLKKIRSGSVAFFERQKNRTGPDF